MSQKFVVIGSKNGGQKIAFELAKYGNEVTLVDEFTTSRSTHIDAEIFAKTLLFRSKKLIEAFNIVAENQDELTIKLLDKDFKNKALAILEKAKSVAINIQPNYNPQVYENTGVRYLQGKIRFIDPKNIELDDELIGFDRCVIASETQDIFPEILGLETTPYLTKSKLDQINKIPREIIIIGAGEAVLELCETFLNLGSSVRLIPSNLNILDGFDAQMSKKLLDYLESKGLEIDFESNINRVSHREGVFTLDLDGGQQLKTETLLIVEGQELVFKDYYNDAGIRASRTIEVNQNLVTSNPIIFAIGSGLSTNHHNENIDEQIKVIISNLNQQRITKLPFSPYKYHDSGIGAVFTSLEFAAYGVTLFEAKRNLLNFNVREYVLEPKENFGALVQARPRTNIKLIVAGVNKAIIGVHILSEKAIEILPEFKAIVDQKRTLGYLTKNTRQLYSLTHSLAEITEKNIVKQLLGDK
jgi:pyruvate/2-oxoglutarate dehydrogenase complex dihydrolipoamide dehydrogenase (E3) component